MSETLYRKYRPKTLAEVSDQEHIKLTIGQQIKSGKMAHAFLFSGPRGVGKTTVARVVSKAINCLERGQGSAEPCNKCGSCEEIEKGRSLDIMEIDAASQTGVDQVRENIIATAKVSSALRKYRVFIIDEVHMLSQAAFNALLKTLEEPPQRVLFILATTEIHKIPATIISRCQRFDFRKINSQVLIDRLKYICAQEGFNVEETVFAAISKHSQGYLRDAISLLGQILSLGERKINLDVASLIIPQTDLNQVWQLTQFVSKKDSTAALSLINTLVEEGMDLFYFANDWVDFLRQILLAKVSNDWHKFADFSSNDMSAAAQKDLSDWAAHDLVKLIEIVISKKGAIKTSEIASLPIELAVVSYCHG